MFRRPLRHMFCIAFCIAAMASTVAGCSSRPLIDPPNELLDDVRTTDLGARRPASVKQPVDPALRRGLDREARIFPGDETALRPRRQSYVDRNSVAATGEGYQLNFEGANIADVTKAVLGDTLQLPYMIDASVTGQLTLATARPVSRDELLKVFETALALNGAALINAETGYRIVTSANAAVNGMRQISTYRRGENEPAGYGVTVMPLRAVAAEAMLRLLDGFLMRPGAARAEVTGNMLLIRGSARERENIAEIADAFDVDWLRGQSAGIFPLTHATPDEMIQELNLLMQNQQSTLSSQMLRFQPVPRLNAVLVVARRANHLQLAGSWIRRLDRSSPAGHQLYVYQVENGKASDIAKLLTETFGNATPTPRRSARAEVAPGRAVSIQSSHAGFSGQDAAQPIADPGFAAGSAAGAGTNAGTIGEASPATAPLASLAMEADTASASAHATSPAVASQTEVRIIADEANNALLIRASQTDYQRIMGALRQIDRAPMQVLINATIAEVTLNNALRYGVQAYLKHYDGRRGTIGYSQGNVAGSNDGILALRPSVPGFNMLFGAVGDPRIVLDALSSVTDVKVVSSPSVVVVDNQPATLKVGDEVPIATQQAQSVVTPDAPVLNTIRFRETGVILRVIPRVNSSGLVTMDVEQEISQVANASGQATNSLTPTISQRRIASTISVYSGQTVALGGLISEQNNRDKRGVPIVDRIPIVGDLIGHSETERKRTELIVFIKPQVIRNGRDAAEVSEDLRSRLRSMAFEPAPRDRLRSSDRRDDSYKDARERH